MSDITVFPDIVELCINHLENRLTEFGDSTPVHRRVPNPRPDQFVRVLRTGGVKQTRVSELAQVTFEAWSVNGADAEDLVQLVRGIVHAMDRTVRFPYPVYAVTELAAPADLPDPVSDQERRTFTVQIHVRGAALSA